MNNATQSDAATASAERISVLSMAYEAGAMGGSDVVRARFFDCTEAEASDAHENWCMKIHELGQHAGLKAEQIEYAYALAQSGYELDRAVRMALAAY